jgi:hypothetical protein
VNKTNAQMFLIRKGVSKNRKEGRVRRDNEIVVR